MSRVRGRDTAMELIIEKVEIRGQYEIKATIFWKNGFRQKVMIHRPPSNSRMDRRWSEEEDELLQTMYQSSSVDTLMAGLPGRSWRAITLRAHRLKLRRNKGANKWRPWSKEDDKQLMLHCKIGIIVEEIANKLGRSAAAIIVRLQAKGLSKPLSHKKRMVSWEISDLLSSQQLPSRGGPMG